MRHVKGRRGQLIFGVIKHIHYEVKEGVDLAEEVPERDSGLISKAMELLGSLKKNFIKLEFSLKLLV